MSNAENKKQSDGMTRRGFLGRVTIGLAAAAALTIPLRNLLSTDSSSNGPGDGLPEDSIYRPKDDSNRDGSLNA